MRETKAQPIDTVALRAELVAAAKALLDDVRANQLAGTKAIAIPLESGSTEWLAIGDAKAIARLLANG